MHNKTKAFTLIELLVVVLIIGILTAIALPKYTRTVEKSRMMEARSNISALSKSYEIYYLERGYYPQSITDLDISIAGTQINHSDFSAYIGARVANNYGEIIRVKDFDYAVSVNTEKSVWWSDSIIAVRNSGKYKGICGIFYPSQKNKIYCISGRYKNTCCNDFLPGGIDYGDILDGWNPYLMP
jgi:prepilin-type N-terminal cleavage/methylation domain-containing protein